jgi:beta-lactamase class A
MPGGVTPLPVVLKVSQELTPLATTIRGLTAQYPGLTLGMFLIDLDNGHYIDLNSGSTFAAASMIKVPILVAFLQDVDAGKIRLDEMLTMQQGDVASESGDMQYQPVGTQYTALETAFKMITISDNTATNMLIARLGGAEQLNQRFRAWGLTNTMIRNPLPDVKGTNTTTPKELSGLLAMVTQGDLLSLRSRDRLLDIMRSTVTNSLLPAGLPPEVIIAHKTGNINAVIGDTGMVDMPSGKRYIISVIVQRSTDDGRAQELIRQISHEVYQSLSQPPANNGSASASPVSTNGQSSPSVTSPAAQSESPTVSVPSGNLSPLPASVSPVPTTPR